jgi:two-component system NtrC family sensor kinase
MNTVDLMRLLEDVSDAVVRLDGQGKYLSMNRRAEELFIGLGRDPSKIIGESVWDSFPELRGTVAEERLREVLDDDVPIEYQFYYPGDRRWYEGQGFPASPGVILVFRDITERKSASDTMS